MRLRAHSIREVKVLQNRIKEQLMLFADRTSTAFLRSNQIRLNFSSMAYLSMESLRRLGLKETELARAVAAATSTIRLKLLKIGALIRVTVRKVWVSMAGGYPYAELWAQIWAWLQLIPLRCSSRRWNFSDGLRGKSTGGSVLGPPCESLRFSRHDLARGGHGSCAGQLTLRRHSTIESPDEDRRSSLAIGFSINW